MHSSSSSSRVEVGGVGEGGGGGIRGRAGGDTSLCKNLLHPVLRRPGQVG